jgi:hypothetical protein
VVSRERENETQADEGVEARHCYAETDLGHSTVRGELDLSGGHGTSPPQLSRPIDHAQKRKSFRLTELHNSFVQVNGGTNTLPI